MTKASTKVTNSSLEPSETQEAEETSNTTGPSKTDESNTITEDAIAESTQLLTGPFRI